ncbi:hypothetical protein [Liquorilactobacillus mali]|nr:hypothetical protein [Liquorilactobacillus mali]MDC7953202.1 hypothetical protein [Liquorilactobacillus mali]
MKKDSEYGLVSSNEELQLLRELDRELKRDEFKMTIGEIVKAKENDND